MITAGDILWIYSGFVSEGGQKLTMVVGWLFYFMGHQPHIGNTYASVKFHVISFRWIEQVVIPHFQKLYTAYCSINHRLFLQVLKKYKCARAGVCNRDEQNLTMYVYMLIYSY